jgi:hypothetical protein
MGAYLWSPDVAEFSSVNALFALLGVLVGWLLGQASEVWRARRQGRDGAVLVLLELHQNLKKLGLLVESDAAKTYLYLEDTAWKAHGSQLMLVAAGPTFDKVVDAYEQVWYANQFIPANEEIKRLHADLAAMRRKLDVTVKAGDDGTPSGLGRSQEKLADALRGSTEPIIDAQRALLPVARLTSTDLLVLRFGRWHQERRQKRLDDAGS